MSSERIAVLVIMSAAHAQLLLLAATEIN